MDRPWSDNEGSIKSKFVFNSAFVIFDFLYRIKSVLHKALGVGLGWK